MTGELRFGLALQNYVAPGESMSPKDLLSVAKMAEGTGFNSIWVWDHIFLGSKNVFPVHESLTVLTAVASVTERVRLATGVLVLPLRNPVELAKRVATIDNLSNGRITLGVAAGWYEKEFKACGVPFASRGSIVETYVKILRRLWTENQISETYGQFELKNISMEPKPVQKPSLPIWMGGYTEKAHQRLGRLADGWICYFYTPESFARGWERVLGYTREAGRDAAQLGNCNMLPIRLGSGREEATRTLQAFVSRYCDLPAWSEATVQSGIAGSPGEVSSAIEAQRNAGVQNIVVVPTVTSLSEIPEQVRKFGSEIIPSFS
jgi:probable F420-dependent oxidoreductase